MRTTAQQDGFQRKEGDEKKWHALSTEEALKEVQSSHQGISEAESKSRLGAYGRNDIVGKEKASRLKIFGRQLVHPLVYILILASGIKFFIGQFLDGTVLAGTILLMVLIGFFQESKAAKAMEALKKLASPKSKVKRNGKIEIVPSANLVPGDIVILESGDFIPADARLLESSNLKVNESSLTGESFPVEKHTDPLNEKLTIADRRNMLFRGTSISYGRGAALIVETGMNTEMGKIARAIGEAKLIRTPLQKSIHKLGNWMLLYVFTAVFIFAAISFYRDLDWITIFMLGISAAVAAIPEGLPVSVTVILAAGMTMMAKRQAVIRKMAAVETLGSTTVICSDKTGTLTENQMTVKKIQTVEKCIEVTGKGNEISGDFLSGEHPVNPGGSPVLKRILEIGALCNDALLSLKKKDIWEMIGDPTEGALLIAAAKGGMHLEHLHAQFPRIDEIPFQSENLYMATLHHLEKEKTVLIKGSPEKLLAFSSSVLEENGIAGLDDSKRRKIKDDLEALAKQAFRLLAAAYCPFKEGEHLNEAVFKGKLIFAGVFALLDPPRKEAIESIRICKKAGMRVVMATGDNKLTAAAIADQLGIDSDAALTGEEIAELSDDSLRDKVKSIGIFARIEPIHKLRIVQAFQSQGHIVAMTGDGVNDAPALETADIGIAMGITGTEVAKESSDMVLADDNFSTIVTAVEEGRAIFSRLRNVAAFLLTTCFGELFGLIACVLFTGLPPLIPIQILWINLATGVLLAIPLGLEPKIGNELDIPPRDTNVGLLYSGMAFRIFYLSFMLGLSIYFVFLWGMHHNGLQEARTIVFSSIVLFEVLVALQMRSDEIPIFKLGILKNRYLAYSILISIILLASILYLPYVHIPFQVERMHIQYWGIALLPGLIIFSIENTRKRLFPKLFNKGKMKKD